MADLPSHPDSDDIAEAPPAARSRAKTVAGIAVAVVLLAAMVVLHLTGVLGPGGH